MCSCRKYPYPPPPPDGRFHTLDPPTPLECPFLRVFWTPPPPGISNFSFSPKSTASANLPRKTAMSKLHIESTMLDLNLSNRIWRTLKTQSKTDSIQKKAALLADLAGWFVDSFSVVSNNKSVYSRFCAVLEWNEFEKESKFLLNVFTSGFYQINIASLCPTEFNLDRNLHNRENFAFSAGSNFNCDVHWIFTGWK